MENAKKFYDGVAGRFDRSWKRYNECTYRLVSALLDRLAGEPQRILDVGCGSGNVLALLEDRFPEAALTGSDISPAMLKQAAAKAPRTRLLEGGIDVLPPGESFDLLTAVSMFHYVEDPADWLARAADLLRPRGALLLVDWNGSAPIMRLRKPFLQRLPHIRHVYGKEEMFRLLARWTPVAQAERSCFAGWWSVQGHLAQVSFQSTCVS